MCRRSELPSFNSDGITNSTHIQRDLVKEVSGGDTITTPGQVRDGLWWLNTVKHEADVKVELTFSSELDENQLKSESLFKTDASNFAHRDILPLALNNDFSFSALVKVLKYGTLTGRNHSRIFKEDPEANNESSVKDFGTYKDYCTIRVRDVSKIKSEGMVMIRTKFEAAWVKPGHHFDQSDASNGNGPHYVKLLTVILTEKIKGNPTISHIDLSRIIKKSVVVIKNLL